MTEFLVTTTADDGAEDSGGTVTTTDSNNEVWSGTDGTGQEIYGFQRFQNVTVGQGATITDATLEVYVEKIYKVPIIDFFGVKDNFDALSASNKPSARTLTTATAQKDYTGLGYSTTDYETLQETLTLDVTAIVQEIVNLGGWASGQAMAFVNYSDEDQARWLVLNDLDHGAGTQPKLNITVSANPSIGNVDTNNIITYDQTGVVVNGNNLSGITEVRLKTDTITETITPDSTTASTVTFDPALGDLPLGAITLELYDGTNTPSIAITINEPASNDYVVMVNPVIDPANLYKGATHTPLTGNILEYTEAADVTVQDNATASIASGSSITSFDVREWRIDLDAWGAWTTFTIAAGGNQNPIVTAPTALVIEIPNGSAGLAKSDSRVVAFLAAGEVTDDADPVTVTGDISALSDPIVVGVHVVPFTSTADTGGLIGADNSQIIITEGEAPNQAPVVTPPSDQNIYFTFGNGGLDKTDGTLITFLAGATVDDDSDSLTASGDVSGLADPIPAGQYTITFLSQDDSGGLSGSDTSVLTIIEGAAPNTPPVVTPPAPTTILFSFGGAGVPKNNVELVAWAQLGTAADDTDTNLIVSADFSALPDPITAGTYTIPFVSALDSGGLSGSSTSLLTIQEGSQNQPPVVTPPGSLTLQYPNGDSGLPKNNSELVSWTQLGLAVDAEDGALTVTADLSALADPILPNAYSVPFNSAPDSQGLVGTSNAILLVQEAPPTLSISPPVGRVMFASGGGRRFAQDPQANLDYWMIWDGWLGGDRLASVDVVAVGIDVGDYEIINWAQVDDKGVARPANSIVSVWLSGAVAGNKYPVTVSIVTVDGRSTDRSFEIFVTDR